MKPIYIPEKKKKEKKPSAIVDIPQGNKASQSFKKLVVKEMLKSWMVIKRNISK